MVGLLSAFCHRGASIQPEHVTELVDACQTLLLAIVLKRGGPFLERGGFTCDADDVGDKKKGGQLGRLFSRKRSGKEYSTFMCLTFISVSTAWTLVFF
jgi:hypothetical protein